MRQEHPTGTPPLHLYYLGAHLAQPLTLQSLPLPLPQILPHTGRHMKLSAFCAAILQQSR